MLLFQQVPPVLHPHLVSVLLRLLPLVLQLDAQILQFLLFLTHILGVGLPLSTGHTEQLVVTLSSDVSWD